MRWRRQKAGGKKTRGRNKTSNKHKEIEGDGKLAAVFSYGTAEENRNTERGREDQRDKLKASAFSMQRQCVCEGWAQIKTKHLCKLTSPHVVHGFTLAVTGEFSATAGGAFKIKKLASAYMRLKQGGFSMLSRSQGWYSFGCSSVPQYYQCLWRSVVSSRSTLGLQGLVWHGVTTKWLNRALYPTTHNP